MDKLEALEIIKGAWGNNDLSLEEKIVKISDSYYSVGLDIATTATFIKATPAEFYAFLSLSNLDDDIIKLISEANPPKTTWQLLASGSDDEIKKALSALSSSNLKNESFSEFIYQQMIEVAGETPEQKISQLTGADLFYLANKAKSFSSVNQNMLKYLNSFAGQKTRGKVLSEKQISFLIDILNNLADNNVIQRNSIDGDEDLCDKVLDALDR